MADTASFKLQNRNPDVLTCIANLSSDEVFTPPEIAGKMLDSLAISWSNSNSGANIWTDSTVSFLDPFTKSGVFLREIVERLNDGLAEEFPNRQERVNHILGSQVFGIGVTELTSLLARRSVYCSKEANGEYSVGREVFDSVSGNIWFERMTHTWVGGKTIKVPRGKDRSLVPKVVDRKCEFCGVSERVLHRVDGSETHAYPFIHSTDIKTRVTEIFGGEMQFDVIIGNPPYQMNDGGGEGSSAIPIYHRFVEQAKSLDPKMLVMVTPARWYSGGKGLNEFRSEMLESNGLVEIHDFPETDLVFPGVNIRGGVCYFLWKRNHNGDVRVVNYARESEPDSITRPLLEEGLLTFVRHNAAISILRKVRSLGEATMGSTVQARNPFGISSNFSDYSTSRSSRTPILLFRSRRGSTTDREVFISKNQVPSNSEFIDRIKVLVSKASPGGDEYPHSIFSAPFVAPKQSASTETYLIVDFPKTEDEANNLVEYMKTRFFRFLVSLIKNTQNISRGCFAFVPVQDFSERWSDEKLFEKYGITDSEISYIESMIRPMGIDHE